MYRTDRFDASDLESSFVIDSLRSGVQDFLRRPTSSTELRQLMDRLFAPRRAGASTPGAVISFISNKGGVGKSTLTVNTACLLAERYPGEVLLVDASLQLGICALRLDLSPATSIIDAVRERERLDETLLRRLTVPHPRGLHLLAAPTDATEASEVDEEAMARILNLARRAYRYTLVDTFPLLDGTVMTILDLSDRVHIVMQGTAPNVIGMAKLLPVLRTLGLPVERQRLILNHNYKSFSGDLTPSDIEGRLGREISHVIPYHRKVLLSMNTGVPCIYHASRRFGFGLSLVEMVEEMESVEPYSHETETRPTSIDTASRKATTA
jgi:pilus assembly protein CpaE